MSTTPRKATILPLCNAPLKVRASLLGFAIERISFGSACTKIRLTKASVEKLLNPNKVTAFLDGYELASKGTAR